MNTGHELDRTSPKAPLRIDGAVWYTPTQLSGLVPWSEATLALWRCQGAGPKYSKVGRRVLYFGTDVVTFLTDRVRDSTAENDTPKPSGPFGKPVLKSSKTVLT